jgi:hypothetical protein
VSSQGAMGWAGTDRRFPDGRLATHNFDGRPVPM